MPLYFLGFIIAFMLTFLMIPLIVQVANNKSILDRPNNRKVHQHETPTLGGVAIYFGFFLALLLTMNFIQLSEMKFIIFAASFMLMTGIIDDIISISFVKKAISQVLSAILIVVWGDVQITNLYGLFGIYEIDGILSICISLFGVITIINAINFIDGIDGNAAFLTILAVFILGIWFHLVGHSTYALLAIVLSGSLLAFLKYNISPAQIFMGDTGSLFVGILTAVLIIKFLQLNSLSVGVYHIKAAPAFALGLLIVPLADIFRVIMERLFSGRSPFNADRCHVHHKLLNLGWNHNRISLTLLCITILFVGLSFILRNIDTNILFGIQLFIIICLVFVMKVLLKRKQLSYL